MFIVLYKALRERVSVCVVLNKIDRLLLDAKMTSLEAFQVLRRLVEEVHYTIIHTNHIHTYTHILYRCYLLMYMIYIYKFIHMHI